MIEELTKLYARDLDRLLAEIKSFRLESNIWETTGNIKNSAGNLSLHLIGNLKTYIGKGIGNYHYVRDREAEFNLKNVPTPILLEQIAETKETVLKSLNQVDASDLDSPYTEEVLGYPMTKGYFLMHLFAHLSYHLGQINYVRRVLEEQ